MMLLTSGSLVLNCAQMLREAGVLTRTEPQNEFIHIDGTSKRPDLQVYNFKGGRACFDVSVTHPALLRHGHSTVPEAGKATGKREHEKFNKYKEIGRAHVRTPDTNAHIVCSHLLVKKKNRTYNIRCQ